MNLLNTKVLAVIFVFSLLFVLGTGWLSQSVQPQGNQVISQPTPAALGTILSGLKVTSYEPLSLEKVTTQPTLKVVLNKKVDSGNLTIQLDPPVSVKTTVVNTTITSLPIKPLSPNTKYTVGVYLDKSKFFEWSITTIGQVVSQNEAAILDSIKTKMPYAGDHFRITYSQTLDQFTITIDTKPSEAYYQNALGWFKSQGVTNLNSLKIKKFLVGQAAGS